MPCSLRRGARACAMVGLSGRTVERWRVGHRQEALPSPRVTPAIARAATQRADVRALVNRPACRDASPHQLVPHLADCASTPKFPHLINRLIPAVAGG